MSQDQSIPRRNKVDWHMANDDPNLTTMRFIPQHEVVQRYGAILPDYLTNPIMKESEAYKTYHDLATGKVQPKPKYVRRSSRTKSDEAPKPSSGTGVTPGVPDVPKYGSDDEQLSWMSGDEEDDDDDEANVGKDEDDDDHDNDDERTESDNDGEDFVHPKFSTHDDEARQEEVNEEDSFDLRVQTPSHVESTDDDEIQSANVTGEEMDKEATNVEGKENELYRDVTIEDTHVIIIPVNPEGQQQSSSVSSGFVSNMLNPRPNTGIDSIFTLNTKATSLIDVLVTTIAEPPLVSATTLSPPPTPLITHMQQTLVPTLITVPSSSLIKKIIKDQVKEQVKAQVSKILPNIEKTINEQLEAEIMTRSSTESKTSLAIAANLSELELKKILIEKMEINKSIHRSNEQKNLYKALVEAYESDKLILDTYGDSVSFKRRIDDKDKDEEPSTGSNRGSKRRRAGKEP
ncbi:hypothetical protein Tco_0488213 [Tanacetum coccineum]